LAVKTTFGLDLVEKISNTLGSFYDPASDQHAYACARAAADNPSLFARNLLFALQQLINFVVTYHDLRKLPDQAAKL
jgi:hypothetical protein